MKIKQFSKYRNLFKQNPLASLMTTVLIIAISVPFSGCSRQHYRQQADSEVSELIGAVARDKRWEMLDYSLQPNQQSRFFDPYHPDCEPMPPDDATAHRYMHCVDSKRNGDWDGKGKTNYVENPYWRQYLTLDENGVLVINKETAFQLAQIHSPEYQQALENLYLSAIGVSEQRFEFDTKFYGGSSLFYTTHGNVRDSTWNNDNGFGFDKKFATGATAVVDVANQITWQLSGADTTSYNTIISAGFIQPFLRNGGREYVLERLTRSERDLLANIRQMAFYRQGFYKTVIFGGNNVGLPTAAGTPGSSSTGVSAAGGYISLLATQVRIANQKANVVSNRDMERRVEALFEAGRINNYVQVEQARGTYLNSQSSLINSVNAYSNSVEEFVNGKIGLPPDLSVKVDDPLLQKFELMSVSLTELQDELENHFATVRDKEKAIPQTTLQELNRISQLLQSEIALVYEDIDKLEAVIPERIENIRFLAQQTGKFEPGYIDPANFSEEAFQSRVKMIRANMPTIEASLNTLIQLLEILSKQNRTEVAAMLRNGQLDPKSEACLNALDMNYITTSTKTEFSEAEIREILSDPMRARTISDAVKDPYRYYLTELLNKMSGQMRFLSVNQARARLDAISMMPIDITPETAIKVAARNRLDWMNARAELVNKWRDIEVTANQLKSRLDFKVNGGVGTRQNNPLGFTKNNMNSQLSVGVEWDAPMTRLLERNAYRESQIAYQRERRNYYKFVDGVNQSLRNTLRNVDNVQFNFEVNRRSVLSAISNVMLAQFNMEKPPEAGASTVDSNATRDLVDALNNLLSAQNEFMTIWVEHYRLRSALCLDLGVMQLDEGGVWIDPGTIREADFAHLIGVMDANVNDALQSQGVTPQSAPSILPVPEYELLPPQTTQPGQPIQPGQTPLKAPIPEEMLELQVPQPTQTNSAAITQRKTLSRDVMVYPDEMQGIPTLPSSEQMMLLQNNLTSPTQAAPEKKVLKNSTLERLPKSHQESMLPPTHNHSTMVRQQSNLALQKNSGMTLQQNMNISSQQKSATSIIQQEQRQSAPIPETKETPVMLPKRRTPPSGLLNQLESQPTPLPQVEMTEEQIETMHYQTQPSSTVKPAVLQPQHRSGLIVSIPTLNETGTAKSVQSVNAQLPMPNSVNAMKATKAMSIETQTIEMPTIEEATEWEAVTPQEAPAKASEKYYSAPMPSQLTRIDRSKVQQVNYSQQAE